MRVLVIDDERAMLTVMKRMLAKLEDVRTAACCQSADEALDAIARSSFDLAFIDIKIGRDDGLELARRLREGNSDMDLVFLTSHKEFAIDSFDIYPLDYMVKPISRERLQQTVARAVQRRVQASPAAAAAETQTRLQVQALGGLDVSSAAAGAVRWRSKKSAELFAYLLLGRGRYVSKSRILEELFMDMAEENARTYLNTAAYQLRQALHPHGLRNAVISSQDQFRLDYAQLEVDFVQFEAFVEGLDVLHADNVAEALHWEQRYAGDLYEDKSYMWALTERSRLGKLYNQFAKRLVGWLLQCRSPEQALPPATRLAQRNELDEEANVLLLRVYGELRDHAALRKHYSHFTGLYRQELGVAVPSELEQQYRRLRAMAHEA
ncbi:response regulator [Paenibacillus sp. IB182496]|uniref:Response regulator n=1 Tax=Paenibacillus sabuli TaxID=2772509 RepID=A0A927C0C2_9BACL|nr:response regulator [Paenibacillus sabuli]MBD2848573.1 response regulator [Paenibacillus sabuli]